MYKPPRLVSGSPFGGPRQPSRLANPLLAFCLLAALFLGASFQSALAQSSPTPAYIFGPNSISGGNTGVASVMLSSPAPAGGTIVSLSSSNPALVVPPSVKVFAGGNNNYFYFPTMAVTAPTSATITASCGGATLTATVTLMPLTAPTGLTATAGGSSVSLSWDAIPGIGRYGLYRATSPGGPYTEIAYGVCSNYATDSCLTNGTTYYYVVTAFTDTVEGAKSSEVSATPMPPPVASVSLSASSVAGGSSVTGTVTLASSDWTAGTTVSLLSSTAAATVPATVTVPVRATSATFTVSTSAVNSATAATISATTSGAAQSATLTVNPSTSIVMITPNSVVGGHTATGLVTLVNATPSGGASVSLTNGTSNLVSIPSTVFVTAGQTQATFPVRTNSVVTTASASITATYGMVSGAVTFPVVPTPAFNTYAYVANYGSATVSVVDMDTSALVTTIPVAAGPSNIVVSPDASTVYVSCTQANQVDVIRTADNQIISTITAGTSPQGLAVAPDGRRLSIVNASAGTILVVDTATNLAVATVPVGSQPYGVTYSNDGRFIYVTNTSANSVSVISSLTNAVLTTVPVGASPKGITALPKNGLIYVANSAGATVSVIDPEAQSVVSTIAVASGPTTVAGLADGTEAYVTCPGSNTVSVIDAINDVLSQNLPVTAQTTGVALDASGTLFIVTNQASAQVLVKDVDTQGSGLSVATAVGNQPSAVAVANEGVPSPYLLQSAYGSPLSGQVSITPSVSDATVNDSTHTYELYVDGVLADSSDIYSSALHWDTETVPNGTHALVLRAITQYGVVGVSRPIAVTTNNTFSGLALSATTFDPEAPSSEQETLTGSIRGGGNWTVQVQDGSGSTVTSFAGSGTTFSATWNGTSQSAPMSFVAEGPYAFIVTAQGTTSGTKQFAKSRKTSVVPPLIIVNGIPGEAEASQRAQLAIFAAQQTGTSYKYLITPTWPALAHLFKDPNCRYFYFNGHGGTFVNQNNPADGSVLDGIVNATTQGYTDDPETVISLGGKKTLEVTSHLAYWDIPFRSHRGRKPHQKPTIASLGLRYQDQFRFVYLDGCETGLSDPDGTHGTIAHDNDMNDYFGIDNAPFGDEGFYFGWQTTVLVPESDPYSFFYWNDRYFRRVASGQAFGTAYNQTQQFSPVDSFVKQNTFGLGAGNATMHP